MIHSSREAVLADIQDLLDWVFSDRFKLQTSSSQDRVKVTATDMKLVVSAASRSMKRVLFLLLIRSAAGKNAISISEISAVTGISRKSTYKAITRLRDQNLLQYDPGARIMTNEGYYASERNRYKVPHYMGRHNEASVELNISDVMKRFNDCYHHAIAQLLTDAEISRCLPLEEQMEHRGFIDTHEETCCDRLDLCGKRISFCSDTYGEIEAYDLGNRKLYPLQDIARLIGWKHPEQMSNHCQEKEKWKVRTQQQVVTKNYIDQVQLRQILQRCRSKNKQTLIAWLCQ